MVELGHMSMSGVPVRLLDITGRVPVVTNYSNTNYSNAINSLEGGSSWPNPPSVSMNYENVLSNFICVPDDTVMLSQDAEPS